MPCLDTTLGQTSIGCGNQSGNSSIYHSLCAPHRLLTGNAATPVGDAGSAPWTARLRLVAEEHVALWRVPRGW